MDPGIPRSVKLGLKSTQKSCLTLLTNPGLRINRTKFGSAQKKRNLPLYPFGKAVKNSKNKEHQEMLDWLGGKFDPRHFDLQRINAELRGLGNLARPSPFSTH